MNELTKQLHTLDILNQSLTQILQVIVLAQCKILIRRANENVERNPYCDCRKVSFRYTAQEFVLSECEHLQDLGLSVVRS